MSRTILGRSPACAEPEAITAKHTNTNTGLIILRHIVDLLISHFSIESSQRLPGNRTYRQLNFSASGAYYTVGACQAKRRTPSRVCEAQQQLHSRRLYGTIALIVRPRYAGAFGREIEIFAFVERIWK
jgi:hypothetical protein